jgi:RP/EB family microtubule-associated protein
MDGLEKERDFYFEKLRQVEIIMQELEDAGKGNDLTASVFKILYATADGFEQVEVTAEESVVEKPAADAEVDFVLENSAVEAM